MVYLCTDSESGVVLENVFEKTFGTDYFVTSTFWELALCSLVQLAIIRLSRLLI